MRTYDDSILSTLEKAPYGQPYVRVEFGSVLELMWTEPWTWDEVACPTMNLIHTEPWSA